MEKGEGRCEEGECFRVEEIQSEMPPFCLVPSLSRASGGERLTLQNFIVSIRSYQVFSIGVLGTEVSFVLSFIVTASWRGNRCGVELALRRRRKRASARAESERCVAPGQGG